MAVWSFACVVQRNSSAVSAEISSSASDAFAEASARMRRDSAKASFAAPARSRHLATREAPRFTGDVVLDSGNLEMKSQGSVHVQLLDASCVFVLD